MDHKKYSCVVKFIDFSKRSRSEKKFIDKESVLQTVNSPEFQDRLTNGRMLGLFTHRGRNDRLLARDVPYEDAILLSPDFVNVTREVEVTDEGAFAGMDIVNYNQGPLVKEMLKSKLPISVSMATKSVPTRDAYIVKDIMGIDFTMKPDLDASVISVNFSQEDKLYHISQEVDVVAVTDKNFSIQDYVREMQLVPAVLLKRRVDEVIRFCSAKPQKFISEKLPIVKNYVETYIYQWVLTTMQDPTSNFNLSIGLRLSQYVSDRKVINDLQRILIRVRNELQTKGTITPTYQTQVNNQFQMLMARIYEYIGEQLAKSGKFFR